MFNFPWLEYIANPFALVAVITALAGVAFRVAIQKMEKPKSGFVISMYGMFLTAIVMLGLGGLAIYFMLSGSGANDDELLQTDKEEISFSLLSTAHADWLWGSIFEAVEERLPKTRNWIWAGQVNKFHELDSPNVSISGQLYPGKPITIKRKTYVRSDLPEFNWLRLRYILGEQKAVLSPQETRTISTVKIIGKNVWLEIK